jgi:hypothetical protein
MAGDPLNGGGFVVVNGIGYDSGRIRELEVPYPGGNLFSLASGGAVYIRDPASKVGVDQLNGGQLGKMSQDDWQLILPYLLENQELFGVKIEDLLRTGSQRNEPEQVYRKIEAIPLKALTTLHG